MKLIVMTLFLALLTQTSHASGSKSKKEEAATPAAVQQPAAEQPMPAVGQGGNIVFFQIMASNLSRARSFYVQLFGWKIGPQDGLVDALAVQAGNMAGRIRLDVTHKGSTSALLYVEVEDVKAAYKKAFTLGAKKTQPLELKPQAIPGGQGIYAVVVDTEGNSIGLFGRKKR